MALHTSLHACIKTSLMVPLSHYGIVDAVPLLGSGVLPGLLINDLLEPGVAQLLCLEPGRTVVLSLHHLLFPAHVGHGHTPIDRPHPTRAFKFPSMTYCSLFGILSKTCWRSSKNLFFSALLAANVGALQAACLSSSCLWSMMLLLLLSSKQSISFPLPSTCLRLDQ